MWNKNILELSQTIQCFEETDTDSHKYHDLDWFVLYEIQPGVNKPET